MWLIQNAGDGTHINVYQMTNAQLMTNGSALAAPTVLNIPAPDVYTDEQTMAWIMDTISMIRGHTELGVVTGKPISLGGSQGRAEATARGCLYALREACRVKGVPLNGARVAVHGFGNAGANIAHMVAADGTPTTVYVDKDFNVVSVDSGGPGAPAQSGTA